MMKSIKLAALALVGLALGSMSALWMSGLIGTASIASFADVNIDGWASDRSIGAASADAYTRARVARHGLLALAKEEAIYFTRKTDDDGDPLSEGCTYQISGRPQDAFWWSITLYDAESRLPMNDDDALSIDATTVGNTDAWTAIIASRRPASEHWLSSRSADVFDLTLRLYRPAANVIEHPHTNLVAPKIRKLECGETE
ncbi:MAG: DUF1214 domain-containing protein [Hyphomonadaceae bacterium]